MKRLILVSMALIGLALSSPAQTNSANRPPKDGSLPTNGPSGKQLPQTGKALPPAATHPDGQTNAPSAGPNEKDVNTFERFQQAATVPPAAQPPTTTERAPHKFKFFWVAPYVLDNPPGFEGSHLWQRTFDPRCNVWTTPRIPSP
jgi:hypothetical protein